MEIFWHVNKLLHRITMHSIWVHQFNHIVMHWYYWLHKPVKLRRYICKKTPNCWARNIFTVQNYRVGIRRKNVIQWLTPKLGKSLTNTFPVKSEHGGKNAKKNVITTVAHPGFTNMKKELYRKRKLIVINYSSLKKHPPKQQNQNWRESIPCWEKPLNGKS